MADQTFEAQQFADALARASAEFERYGKLSQSTNNDVTDASMKAKYGLSNFTQAAGKGATAAIDVGRAMGQAASAMYQGKKGATAFNDSIDTLTSAAKAAAIGLFLLGGPLGMLAAAVVTGIAAFGEYAKAANEMSEKLYKGYQGLAESGAAAADGMDGLFEDAKKLGLSMNDLGQYTSLIAANSKDLALFSGSVYQGRQAFADVVEGMDKFKLGLMNTGLTQEQINAGAMSYLKLQTRVGLSQNKTTQQLADGANKYLLEMDALSKVTGETRKGMEETMEAARSEERFRAKLDAMRASGNAREIKQADELELANVVLTSRSKQMGQAFRDVQSGAITSEASQKGFITTQGELMRSSDQLRKGQITYMQLVDNVGQATGRFNKAMNQTAQFGSFNEFAIDYAQGQDLFLFTQKSATEKLRLANVMVGKQADGANAAVDANSRLTIQQQKANQATERFIKEGIVASTEGMIVLAKATTAAANTLNKLAGIKTDTSSGGSTPSSQMAPGSGATKMPGTQAAGPGGASASPSSASTGTSAYTSTRPEQAPQMAAIREMISAPESKGNYNVIVGGDTAPLTDMTVGEVMTLQRKLISEKKGSAVGKYQVIATTLREVVGKIGLKNDQKFDAATQDAIADFLIKRRGFDQYARNPTAEGKDRFLKNLSQEWAGLPSGPDNKSYYAGVGNNKSGLNWKDALQRFAEGGIVPAMPGGTPVVVGEAGRDEAVIPLKGGAVPVNISLKDALSKPSMMGQGEYSGYNMGPMSTDINAVRDIATSMGAFDKASQTITNPETWKQIINSGVAMNYDMGMAKIGTSIIPGIGIEIGNAVKELQAQKSVDTETAIKEIAKQFAEALPGIFQASMANNANAQADGSGTQEMAGLLQQLVDVTRSSNDIQTKILRSAN